MVSGNKHVVHNRALPVGVAVLCLGILGVGVIIFARPAEAPVVPVQPVVTTASTTVEVVTLPRALPTRLKIAKINLDVPFVAPLGLEANGEVAVPDSFTDVGWYQYSPTPGELGPAVVLGHVDSRQGPAVFFSLGQLEPGDEVLIDRADGSTARFIVDRLERYEQVAFPTQAVYGNIDHAGLRLITCSGTYERGRDRYTHNLVVYARLATGDMNSTGAEVLNEG